MSSTKVGGYVVGPRPQRRDYYVRGIGRGKIFRQQAYDDAVGAWVRKRNEEREESRAARASQASLTVCPMCKGSGDHVDDEGLSDTVKCDACKGDGFI